MKYIINEDSIVFAMALQKFDSIIQRFSNFTHKPTLFLSAQNDIKDDIKHLIKDIYDHTKEQEDDTLKRKLKTLRKLIVDNFDEEQIWQEIELQNSARWEQLLSDVSKCIAVKKDLSFPLSSSKKGSHLKTSVKQDVVPAASTVPQHKPVKAKSKTGVDILLTEKKQGKSSIVDDKFFKLDEMEKFLIKEDKVELETRNKSDSDEESINIFEDIEDEDDGEKDVMYSDFFKNDDQHEDLNDFNKNKDTESMNSDQDTDDESAEIGEPDVDFDIENLSTFDKSVADDPIKLTEFQLRQKRLKERIDKLESKTLEDKPWQLKGEVSASNRPQNSLLQEVVDFDLTSRPPPVITKESTLKLEDIIKRRILDKAWDDVEKKAKPVEDVHTFKKTVVLDQSKSKLSLAQVYEAEYLKQKQNLNENKDTLQEEPQEHIEIKNKLKNLFSKLDALSHCHYTPKPAQPEVRIISNVPAITLEEVVPVAVSDAGLLAPEEIKGKRSGLLMSKNERTITDKKRERRKKKRLQKKKAQLNLKSLTNEGKSKKFGK